jgi:hypothetical protein
MPVPTYTREQLLTLISTKLANNSIITAPEHREVEEAIVNAIYGQVGDIKEIACDINYINANFKTGTSLLDEGLGLPTGERYGWAICNGKNGTINKMGRVAIGYDPSNFPITTAGGNTGGERNVTLNINQIPTHSHDIQFRLDSSSFGDFFTIPYTSGNDEGSWSAIQTGGNSANGSLRILDKGGNQAHNNMQPYIVTLFIQRIPMP